MTDTNILKVLSSGISATIALVFLIITTPSLAQNGEILYQPDSDSPIGERNPKGSAELAQFDFIIGDWDAVVTYTVPGKTPIIYTARWHNTWILNGLAVMQEWRGPYATGEEFRYFDPNAKKWTGYNLYSGSTWKETRCEWQDNKMVVYSNGENQNGAFTNRETYYDIKDNSVKLRSDRSFDGGKTWKPYVFTIEMNRITDQEERKTE